MDHRELALVKGYARGVADLWVGHWWCVDRDGRVVDPSWRNEGTAYIGVETVDVVAMCGRLANGGYFDLELEPIPPPALAATLDRVTRERCGPVAGQLGQ
jgi:hypothetical protein